MASMAAAAAAAAAAGAGDLWLQVMDKSLL